MYRRFLLPLSIAIIGASLVGCSFKTTTTPPKVTLPDVYDEYETETNSEGEVVVIIPSTDENGETEYITEIATDEAGENITVPPTTEAPTEPVTEPSKENQTTEPVTEPSGEGMTEAPTQKPTVKPTEPTTSKKEDSTTKPTSKPTVAPTTEATTQKPTQPSTTEAQTQKPTEKPTVKPTEAPTQKPTEAPTQKPTVAPTEKPTQKPTEAPTTAPDTNKDKVIKATDSDFSKYSSYVQSLVNRGAEIVTDGTWVYRYVKQYKAYWVIQYVGNATKVTVPVVHNNIPVSDLANTFEDNLKVTEVIIPANSSITNFTNTFNGCDNLKKITIGKQSAISYVNGTTFTFGSLKNCSESNSTYVYCDENFVRSIQLSASDTILYNSNCTFVITMNDGSIAYDHAYYNVKDCTLHSKHYYN